MNDSRPSNLLFHYKSTKFNFSFIVVHSDDGTRSSIDSLYERLKMVDLIRYVFDLYHRRKEISAELDEFCLDQDYADRNLIAKWLVVEAHAPMGGGGGPD
ncbi:protein BUD31 homolog 1 [Tanacetum coccineum]